MSQTDVGVYDEIPYEGDSYPAAHPDRLATIATLLGLRPPPVERCRVLELGCACGGNLLPMALTLPHSSFVGVDASSRQIDAGQGLRQRLGLNNVELQQRDILDLDASLGRFDYILCHGVFSWVATPVQDKILEVCSRCLAPEGVAYLSYNTFPGWHMRRIIRDMMCYHANQFREPQVRVAQARNLLDFLAKSTAGSNNPFAALLQSELKSIQQSRDWYIFHEQLEPVNEPSYFHEVQQRAGRHGLGYLGDADFPTMFAQNFPAEVQQVLTMLASDRTRLEQYMDFVRNRTFRQSLWCHDSLRGSTQISPEAVVGLLAASPARPVSALPDLHSATVEAFRAAGGLTLHCSEPIAKAALVHLAEVWPHAVALDALAAAALGKLGQKPPSDPGAAARGREALAGTLLAAYTKGGTGLLELHTHQPVFTLQAGERPLASPLARLQAETSTAVTNLRHERVVLSDFGRLLLPELDGRKDRAALVQALAARAQRGELQVRQKGPAGADRPNLEAALAEALHGQLAQLGRQALLLQ